MSQKINIKLKIWRQKNSQSKGKFEKYSLNDISTEMSFLEMLDVMNEKLIHENKDPVAFDHDCREGICGMCSLVINGRPTITIEPFRARAFPVLKDLIVDRSAFDRIMQAGGYISVRVGSAPDSHSVLIPKIDADISMDAAACIGCGACVATCKNASAVLFTGAKISQLCHLPQGKVEASRRAKEMMRQMKNEGFGNCTNEGECSAVCPAEVKQMHLGKLNREYLKTICKS
jgi:succinate dehydrogenase / fumarate reductase iron-sulfur subunit